MIKLLKRDFYSVLRSRTTLILLGALFLVSIGMHSFSFEGSKVTFEYSFVNVKNFVTDEHGEKYENFEDYWFDQCRAAIPRVFGGNSTIILYALVFTPFFITNGLNKGYAAAPIYAGVKRNKTLISRALCFYIAVCILVQLGFFTSLTINRFDWWRKVTAVQMLQVVGVRLLADLAILSITLAITVSFGRSYKSVAAVFVFVALPSLLLSKVNAPFLSWGMHSHALFANIIGIAENPKSSMIITTVIASVIYTVASNIISVQQFNKLDMRVIR